MVILSLPHCNVQQLTKMKSTKKQLSIYRHSLDPKCYVCLTSIHETAMSPCIYFKRCHSKLPSLIIIIYYYCIIVVSLVSVTVSNQNTKTMYDRKAEIWSTCQLDHSSSASATVVQSVISLYTQSAVQPSLTLVSATFVATCAPSLSPYFIN